MKSTNFPRFVVLLTIAFVSNALHAQTTKDAIILYNSQPVKAEINSNGDVLRIISEEPDYLKGFTLKIQDYGQFISELNKGTTDDQGMISSNKIAFEESDDFISVPFDHGFATLSDMAIKRLDDVILYLKSNPSSKVVIRTLSTHKDALLDKNRINSVRTYFKIRGITSERLSYEALLGDKDIEEVKINYIH